MLRYNLKKKFLWGCFWLRVAFKSVDRIKQITILNANGHHPSLWGEKKQKYGERKKLVYFSLTKRAGISASCCLRSLTYTIFVPISQVLGLLLETSLDFPNIQHADASSCDFSASIIISYEPIPSNNSLYVNVCVSPIGSVYLKKPG